MKKILDQELYGNEETAKAKAIYTWEKDEIAWYFCNIFKDVFKVVFTGEHWISGNKWRYNKIYQYKYLDSSKGSNDSLVYKGDNGISHGQENIFYTTKEEAIADGLRYINNSFNAAKDNFVENTAKLLAYR